MSSSYDSQRYWWGAIQYAENIYLIWCSILLISFPLYSTIQIYGRCCLISTLSCGNIFRMMMCRYSSTSGMTCFIWFVFFLLNWWSISRNYMMMLYIVNYMAGFYIDWAPHRILHISLYFWSAYITNGSYTLYRFIIFLISCMILSASESWSISISTIGGLIKKNYDTTHIIHHSNHLSRSPNFL